ncbi:predicted protein [Nematostella vectensis]|uniref:RAB6A-GEF complex partner protein 2 n=1 Tax=Nematostella vectensis TaxID=45351 RepID=A7SX95_NEMVE|nr:predicted protein [Nematostella vectensis]|eukprot:XP_001623758.1 predicted protein [Nematostella vectensis]
MIEVKASTTRGAVYFAGESVRCEIVFTNGRTSHIERLAWASAQIHCQCTLNSLRVVRPVKSMDRITENSNHELVSDSSTSFTVSKGEHGHCILSTQPKILFCDLELAPGESKTFLYTETIPSEGPPSYRGQAVKYSYKLTLGTSRVQSQIRLIRLPLRILVVQGLSEIQHLVEYKEQPSNPFLEKQTLETSLLDIGVDFLNAVTSRRNSYIYSIVSERGTVGKFCLFKSAYRIGEEIVGSFDFDDSLISCLKYTVTLQSEEHIPEECQTGSSKTSPVTYSSYGSVQESCLHTKKSHLILPVSITVCPEFVSDLVCLKWRLHFEFVLASSSLPAGASPLQSTYPQLDTAMWQAPSDIDTELMTWDLPIKLVATNPVLASSVSMLKTSNSIYI